MTMTPASSSVLADHDRIRACFPALDRDLVFLENAGGSQVPAVVADAVRDYLLNTYVQLGAPYALSQQCTQTVADAHAFVNRLMNGEGIGHTILASSCTVLCTMLAACYAEILNPGDEIIVADTAHEANRGPWTRLAARGATIRHWAADPTTGACALDDLRALLSDRTRLVAFPHVSNLLGGIVDVKAITEIVHGAGAKVVVDGVAYAPHRAIDVRDWNVDWYVYSTYKVYGPHMAALFGTHAALAELTGPNHFFVPRDDVPYKFELGGASHEGCAGLVALGDYLTTLTGTDTADRATIEQAFEIMTACELPLQTRLIEYLDGRDDVRVVGPATGGVERVGTISFTHATKSSREISEAVCARGIAVRYGHMYAHRLCEVLGIDLEDGVVRVSFVHYNTMDEIERLIAVLDEVLAG